jgi:long-chain acyl-CoA synthetase
VENRYQDIIGALYTQDGTVHCETSITYEDGREVEIKADVRLQNVEEAGGKK